MTEQEEEQPKRRRISRYKSEEEMWRQIEGRVINRKRLTLQQGMWLHNRHANAKLSLDALEKAHTYTLHELEEAQQTNKWLHHELSEAQLALTQIRMTEPEEIPHGD